MIQAWQRVLNQGASTFVARQPIVDRDGRTVAYELLFRNGHTATADVVDGFGSTAHVVERTVGALGLDTVLAGLDGYLNCTSHFLHSDVPQILTGPRFVLEVLESCELDESLKKRCNALRAAGFRVALDDVAKLTPDIIAFLPAVDIVKLEWPAVDAPSARAMVGDLKRAGKIVVAEKIDSHEQWHAAIGSGCDMVQGFYFSRPQVMEARRLVPDLGQLVDLLNLLIEDAGDHRVIHALSDMPVLVAQVLRLANCSGNVNPKRTAIASLHHALAAIGTTRLFQWCSLLLYNHPDPETVCRDPLIALARQRASFMLDVALFESPNETAFAQTAYLTGMLSLLHVVYGRQQDEFAEELPLEPGMKAALTGRSGKLGELLGAAEIFERGRDSTSEGQGQR
ncbi:EAL domain-containing protein [Burkholderia vietnamiensis]|uniref:EAL and HDOD domain-containing protein n=1 Tax=Burkholderia vietnamiensis TaxID=60552 RepID=UPI000841C6D5|nr:EAL domain-containing protein [Burkholderia vietnamiensis]AOJ16058.1 diguanylate phosphodiesterase [Burkholderia vietnamiensis]MBR7916533.1 EAL domain-containing protein [Burkholderia vietnamiensis]